LSLIEESHRAVIFVRHIQRHLDENPELFGKDAKVICKICRMTIDEIYEKEKGGD